ncbi:MAG: HAMP domain-containing protein, partial [Alphaproteobacteria bacterium]|nr:HAMP domain-containing protein [Alphaproteobacteria bacterium]
MLNRLSANSLLKSVIAVMAAIVVFMLSVNVWESWARLSTVGRILNVAESAGYSFRVMHRLRTDRSSTYRVLTVDDKISSTSESYIRELREAEVPNLKSALELLAAADFAEKSDLYPKLQLLAKQFAQLQDESWQQMHQPKETRRAGLAKEFMDNETALLEVLDKISSRTFAGIKHEDAVVDQMIEMKQLAWVMRNTAGEASLIVSNGLAAGKLPPETRAKYDAALGGAQVAWDALQDLAYGTELPPKLKEAMATAKASYFSPDFMALRERLMVALLTGGKPEMNVEQWSPETVNRFATLVGVAEAALDAGKQHAEAERSSVRGDLAMQLGLLAGALALAAGAMLAVTRRVINPLRIIKDAMLKLAGGDLSAEAPYADRSDEIGALAGALGVFKQNAVEKTRIEAEQRARHEEAAARQQKIEGYIAGFEGQVREALEALSGASGEMRSTSDDLSMTAAQ